MAANNEKTYWPHMIVGFLILAFTLSYWTVKSASSMPVQESNSFMLKYQKADMDINDILTKKKRFDASYTIALKNVETMVMTDNVNSNVPQPNPVKLTLGKNDFSYVVSDKSANLVSDANVTFLLTQPHSRREDILIENVPFIEGSYTVKGLELSKAGRYTLQLRVGIDDETIGYSEKPAYLTKISK